MNRKVKDIDTKKRTFYSLNDIINAKDFDLNNMKLEEKIIQKYSYLLYWICDDQEFEMHKNL